MVVADDGGAAAPRFSADARGDVDGDGVFSYYGYVRPSPGQAAGLPGAIPGTTCQGLGVFVPGGGLAVNVPGPCDQQSGVNRF